MTNGTLSNPRLLDDNGGKQIAARVALTPAVGWILGVSGARGAWLAREIPQPNGAPLQRALGADVEYSRDHWIVRGELVWSRWSFPEPLAPSNAGTVGALGTWAEGRYRITPRVYLAGRADRLAFSRLRGSVPRTRAQPWDAPVTRIEAGFGVYLQRNFVLRAMAQANWRLGRPRPRADVPLGAVRVLVLMRIRRTTTLSIAMVTVLLYRDGGADGVFKHASASPIANGTIRGRVELRQPPSDTLPRTSVTDLGMAAPHARHRPPQRRLSGSGPARGVRHT